jgi:hypothetical protein
MDTYVGFEFEIERKIKTLIDKLMRDDIINCEHAFVSDYHSTKNNTSRGIWRIENDCSLQCGAEFISPPQKLEQSIETMRTFLESVKEHGSSTSTRCGCHTNMSLMTRGKILKIDEDELLANVNWRLMSSLWGTRLTKLNIYCRNLSNMFTQIKRPTSSNRYSIVSNKSGIGNELFTRRNSCIIRKKNLMSKNGFYYELRFPGGPNYHKHPGKIEQTVRHFSEILEKSRKSSCNNKKVNKRIVSYINRLQPVNFSWIELIRKDTTLVPTIKKLANTYQNLDRHVTEQDCAIKTLTNSVSNVLSRSFSIFDKKDKEKVRSVLCKNHLFYYLLKYAFFNYSNNKGYMGFNPLPHFKNMAIGLTIPKEESDFDKLWLATIYSKTMEKEKVHIIKSIKSNKAKVIFKKMTEDSVYRAKIINAQKIKKKQQSDNK